MQGEEWERDEAIIAPFGDPEQQRGQDDATQVGAVSCLSFRTPRLMLDVIVSVTPVLVVRLLALQAVSVSNILRNWALMPGSERLLADAACVHTLTHALEAVSHDSGPAAAELAGNLLDVLQQVLAGS